MKELEQWLKGPQASLREIRIAACTDGYGLTYRITLFLKKDLILVLNVTNLELGIKIALNKAIKDGYPVQEEK